MDFDSKAWQRRAIEKAKDGDIGSAWMVIRALLVDITNRPDLPPSFSFAADFFEELLEICDARHPRFPRGEDLAPALEALHIVPGRGRPRLPRALITALFATEELLKRREGLTVEKARERNQDTFGLSIERQRGLRTENLELAKIMELLSEPELEGLILDAEADKK